MCHDPEMMRSLQRHDDVVGANYTLGKVLGLGGMGVVYSAVQRSLDRKVAIKMPRPEMARDPAVLRRFRTEALAGSRINHSNVVRVLDFGDDHGVPYLVMEYVDGPRLGHVLRERGPESPLASVDVASQLLSALAAAHAAGVLHDDVKCDNVLVETLRDGTRLPRLIDFGLARFTDAPATADDRERMVSGTPEYLAPELIRGEAPAPASDLYAVGIVLYELVTGATPFAGGTNKDVMQRQLCDDPVPMIARRRDSEIPLALERAVRRALAKNPADRFSSANAFQAALVHAMSTVPREPPVAVDAVVQQVDEPATAPMVMADSVRLRMDAAPRKRRAISEAIDRGRPDGIVLAYLELARVLVDSHALEEAILELQAGVALLTAPSGKLLCASVWRLQLTLAALYDGNGDRALAREMTLEARARATTAGADVGCDRATDLLQRLSSTRRSSARRPTRAGPT